MKRNPVPRAWGAQRGSTRYPCKGKHVGKALTRRGRQYVVAGCATPARPRDPPKDYVPRGQYWLDPDPAGARPGRAHAVPKRAVSRALARAGKPQDAAWRARVPRLRPASPPDVPMLPEGYATLYTPSRDDTPTVPAPPERPVTRGTVVWTQGKRDQRQSWFGSLGDRQVRVTRHAAALGGALPRFFRVERDLTLPDGRRVSYEYQSDLGIDLRAAKQIAEAALRDPTANLKARAYVATGQPDGFGRGTYQDAYVEGHAPDRGRPHIAFPFRPVGARLTPLVAHEPRMVSGGDVPDVDAAREEALAARAASLGVRFDVYVDSKPWRVALVVLGARHAEAVIRSAIEATVAQLAAEKLVSFREEPPVARPAADGEVWLTQTIHAADKRRVAKVSDRLRALFVQALRDRGVAATGVTTGQRVAHSGA